MFAKKLKFRFLDEDEAVDIHAVGRDEVRHQLRRDPATSAARRKRRRRFSHRTSVFFIINLILQLYV
jgi:hypothetical protein